VDSTIILYFEQFLELSLYHYSYLGSITQRLVQHWSYDDMNAVRWCQCCCYVIQCVRHWS